MSTIIIDSLYNQVETALSKKENVSKLKTELDKYLSANTDKYSTQGPVKRPIFNNDQIESFIKTCGLDRKEVMSVIGKTKAIDPNWKIMNNPMNVTLALATRYFAKTNSSEGKVLAISYTIVFMYPSLHFKYFKYEPNEALMAYTINNLSNKFKIKQQGYLWITLLDIVNKCYELHKNNLIKGEDRTFILYIQDVKTRLNSFMKKISNEFYRNEKEGKYLNIEHESFDEENYFESDNNSYAIDRLTNKVVTSLVVNGGDMKLIELAAKMNNVSVNQFRSYIQTMINEKQRADIKAITESILFLFLFSDNQHFKVEDVRSNQFLLYCLGLYKKSNTSNRNIIKIKDILDKWLDELGLLEKTSNDGTINDYRRALFSFFVLSIQKNA